MAVKTRGRLNLRAEADRIAQANGIPKEVFRRLISKESGWDPNARSPAGAIGLGQLMPGTARGLGVDPTDPIQNLQGAAKYLRHQLDTFGSMDLALAAYNAGPGAVQKYNGVPPYKETQNYVKSIMGGMSLKGELPLPQKQPAPGALGQMMGDQQPMQQQSRLGQLINDAAPSNTTVKLLGSLGDMAGNVAKSAQAPIPTPNPHPSPSEVKDPFAIEGSEDTTPGAQPSGEKPIGGLNAEFARRFSALQKAVQQAGGSITIFSGARDARQQAKLFQDALAKYGSVAEARKHVAPPGKSNHDTHAGLKKGLGDGALASDLRGDLAIAHRLAARYGLVFPMSYEPWHIELAGARGK